MIIIGVLLVLAILATIAREIVWSKMYKAAIGRYTNRLIELEDENEELHRAAAFALTAVEYAAAEMTFSKQQVEQLLDQ